MAEERKIFSLTKLNQSLERHFFKHFSNSYYWITAEVIRINEKRGHHYLELADSIEKNTTARAQGVIWKSVYDAIVTEIGLKECQTILAPGNSVLMNVKIEFHPIYGLKLKIRKIDPSYSYGEIERKKREVINRLKKEGLFARQKQIHLPIIIKKIVVIGAPNTSGYRDFLNELFNNHNFTNFTLKTFSVAVQGEPAKKEVAKAIYEANQFDADVIVLLRGGGSKMDLALFDDYNIAKAICLSRLPVMTGIGHETDEVVADLVARIHFITPTAVGNHIQYEIESFKEIIAGYQEDVLSLAREELTGAKEEFVHLNNYLHHYSRELIHFWRNEFQTFRFMVSQNAVELTYYYKENLQSTIHQLSTKLNYLVRELEMDAEQQLEKIKKRVLLQLNEERELQLNPKQSNIYLLSKQVIEKERLIFGNQEELLKLLNPLKILKSGYTITTKKEKDIQDVVLEIGDEIKTLSSKGLVISKITNKQKIEYEDK